MLLPAGIRMSRRALGAVGGMALVALVASAVVPSTASASTSSCKAKKCTTSGGGVSSLSSSSTSSSSTTSSSTTTTTTTTTTTSTTTTSSTTSTTSSSTSTSSSTPAVWSTVGELANGGGQDQYLGSTGGYQWIVLQEGEYADIPAIKAANPNTKVLAYEDAAVTEGPNSCQYDTHPATGVSYCYANTYHPEWFLTDSSGNRLTYSDFPSDYAMDIGSSTYQSEWMNNVETILKRDGWDGVFMDDVNTVPGHGLNGRVAKYTDVQYGDAMLSFVSSIAPALRAAGLATVGNVAADPWTSSQESIAENMASSVGGYFREFWQRWGSGSVFTDSMWTSLMAQADNVQNAGAFYIANTYGGMSETAVMAYVRASFLLAWNGTAGAASMWDPGNTNPYSAVWTASIGQPSAARYQVGSGWRRDYSGGIALVDPSSTTAQTFSLPSGTWTASDGSTVSGSITLQPGTGTVLVP